MMRCRNSADQSVRGSERSRGFLDLPLMQAQCGSGLYGNVTSTSTNISTAGQIGGGSIDGSHLVDSALLNAHKLAAQGIAARTAAPRYGVVQSVDPANHAAKVTVQPEGVLTGWLPVLTHSMGNGWGIVSLPTPGTQVMLLPQEGDGEEWAVGGRVFDTEALPPKVAAAINGSTSNAQPGEIALVSEKGGVIRLAADGSIYMLGNVNIQGNLIVSGDISDKNNVHSTLDVLRQDYNTHLHPGTDSHGDSFVTSTTTKPTP
jgi:phage baseplate assembly protein gpV